MGLFDRFMKKPEPREKGYKELSAMGDDPKCWTSMSDEELKQVVMIKCVEYGISQNGSRIRPLFALYQHVMGRLNISERMKMLNQYSAMTEERKGKGHMGLMMFLIADTNPGIRSTAAMSLSVLYEPEKDDVLSGPKFVVRTLADREMPSESQGEALGGVLLLGDKRLLPLLEETWSKLSEEARLGLTHAKSGFVNEASVEFWLRCLEKGCSDSVFGSVVAAIAKMPIIAQAPFVLDVQRVLPAYQDRENPMRILRKTSFTDYLSEIRPRLKALEQKESEPKVIPKIYEIWRNPDQFQGIIG